MKFVMLVPLLILNRSQFLQTQNFSVASVAKLVSSTDITSDRKVNNFFINESVQIILSHVDESFLRQILDSGKFLYRGRENFSNTFDRHSQISVSNSKPDLFDLGTYDDARAIQHFKDLEITLSSLDSTALPSNSHIATPILTDAGQWGTPVSIWPLEKTIHYVWNRKDKLFWPATLNNVRRGIVVDSDLASALVDGHEVMFKAESFLEIPSTFDNTLRSKLLQAKL